MTLVDDISGLSMESGGDLSAFSLSDQGALSIEMCCRQDGDEAEVIDIPIHGHFLLPKVGQPGKVNYNLHLSF